MARCYQNRISVAFSIFVVICCRITFAKDDGKLRGHLKPLGSHKPPTVEVDEFVAQNAPQPAEFYEKYVKPSRAAVFRGAITDSRAFNLWTDEYIRENFGEMEVRLEGKHEKRHFPPVGEKYLGRDTLRHFVDNYHDPKDNTYIVSDLPSKMYGDVDVVPSLGACGEMRRHIVEVDLWWSGGGSYSVIHKDAFNQMNCLINGTKYWKLIENKYEKFIYKHPEPEYEIGGFSDINPKAVDLEKYPNATKLEWSNITIHAGDCLFLPKSYYHQVQSEGTNNLAVSLLFTRFDERESLDFSDCSQNTDYYSPRPLTDFDVQLVWKGTGMMMMGRFDLEEQCRGWLLQMTEKFESEGKKCDFEGVKSLFDEYIPNGKRRMGEISKAFEIIDKDGDGFVTNKEAKDLTLEDLRLISNEVEIFEPSNSYKFEYSIITFEMVWWAVNYYLKTYEVLEKETWIREYLKLGGSRTFGEEIFSHLSDGKSSIVSREISKGDIWRALENWIYYWAPQYSILPNRPKEEDEVLLQKFWAKGGFKSLEKEAQDDEEEQQKNESEKQNRSQNDEL